MSVCVCVRACVSSVVDGRGVCVSVCVSSVVDRRVCVSVCVCVCARACMSSVVDGRGVCVSVCVSSVVDRRGVYVHAHVTRLHALCDNRLPRFCVPAGRSHWVGARGAGPGAQGRGMEAGACACVGLPGLRWGQGLSSHHRKCGSPTMVLTFPWVVGLPGVVFTFSVGRGPPRVTRGEDLCPSSSPQEVA